MNTDNLDKAFAEVISKRGIHKKLGETSVAVRTWRNRLKMGETISSDLKLKVLQKAGYKQDDRFYNRKDLISLLKFYDKTSQAARDEGPEYVVEKWEKSRTNN